MNGYSVSTFPKPEKIIDSVYLMKFPTQKEMAQTMLRFQEFYESPKFRGRIFTLDEFKKWYVKRNGDWTYYTDWSGFNIPSSVLTPFRESRFDPISPLEQALLDAVAHIPEPFYIIAVSDEGQSDTLRHEIAHGLYATNPDYRAEVYMLLMGVQLAPMIRYLMNGNGYHYASFLDECHAYLMADFDWLVKDEGVKVEHLREVHQGLKWAFDYYTEGRFETQA